MNCKYHKVRSKKGIKYGYCTLNKKEVSIFGCKCNNTSYKEYKTIRKVTYKHSKSDKERFSTIYTLSDKYCCNCLKTGYIEINEIYEGAKRPTSINNGFVAPLCKECHDLFHNNRKFALKYKILFQIHYQLTHSLNDFMNIIHYNYISILESSDKMEEMINWLKSQIALIKTRKDFDLGMYEAYINCLNKLYEIRKDI